MQLPKRALFISLCIVTFSLKTMENDSSLNHQKIFDQEDSSCTCCDLFKRPFSFIHNLLKRRQYQKMIQSDNKTTIETLKQFININDALIANNEVSTLAIITINQTKEAITGLVESIEEEESGLGIYETMQFIIDANTSHIECIKQLDPCIPQDYITQLEQCSTTLSKIKRHKKFLISDN